jgi:hypothetical protein
MLEFKMRKKELQRQIKLHLLTSIKDDLMTSQGTRDLICGLIVIEQAKDCLDRDDVFLCELKDLDDAYRGLFFAAEHAKEQLTK